MKIVLVEDVEDVGDAGDLKTVKDGYARNFLIPKGLAVKATKNELHRVESLRKAAEVKREKFATEMSVLAKQVEGQSVAIRARVGPTGRLYGSVTTQMIAEAVSLLTGQKISHRRVELGGPLRDLGEHPVTLRLAPEVVTTITVTVEAEGGSPAAAPRAADRVGQQLPAEDTETEGPVAEVQETALPEDTVDAQDEPTEGESSKEESPQEEQ